MSETIKIKLKGNESFNIREGWLCKGLYGVMEDPGIFLQRNATDLLGMGSKMVSSLRFWMQATHLTAETKDAASRRVQHLTEDFGRIVLEYDPYFEDIFTLWMLHYHIVASRELCAAWHIFFNYFDVTEFSKETLYNVEMEEIPKRYGVSDFSLKLLSDDCSSVIRTYWTASRERQDPENNLTCPLTELGLITVSERFKGGYTKNRPNKEKLSKDAVLYAIAKSLPEGRNNISIESLLTAVGSVGRVFNLDKTLLNEYLDELRMDGWITINRTAGLDMVYFVREVLPEDVLYHHYME